MPAASHTAELRPRHWGCLALLVFFGSFGLAALWLWANAPARPAVASSAEASPTASPLPPPTLALRALVIVMPTPSPAPPRTPQPTWPPALATPYIPLPAEAAISDFVGHKQTLSLSCEARAAADWAAYFGVAIDELTFLSQLPVSDDPDVGFVGDVRGEWGHVPPESYGVHAWPVASLLREYGLRARSVRYLSLDDLRAEIAAGRPVMVWVVGHVETNSVSLRYTASSGRQTLVAPFEHTVNVIGYTADSIAVQDGARKYTRPLDTFLDSWAVLGNMAVIHTGP